MCINVDDRIYRNHHGGFVPCTGLWSEIDHDEAMVNGVLEIASGISLAYGNGISGECVIDHVSEACVTSNGIVEEIEIALY